MALVGSLKGSFPFRFYVCLMSQVLDPGSWISFQVPAVRLWATGGRMVVGDGLAPPFELGDFDAIHASTPCQAWTAYKRRTGHVAPRPELIGPVREMLEASGVPWVIENVPGAPVTGVTLCGSSFGLDVRRHRVFETSWGQVLAPPCDHDWQGARFAQAGNRTARRKTVEVGVWRIPLAVQRAAMGIDWMELEELSEALPPAYTEWLGRELLARL